MNYIWVSLHYTSGDLCTFAQSANRRNRDKIDINNTHVSFQAQFKVRVTLIQKRKLSSDCDEEQ